MAKIIYLFFCIIFLETTFCASAKQRIIIFSYGSLVTQNENRKTGTQLQATPFNKTEIMVPISFTFIAGLPSYLIKTNKKNREKYPLRRATATIDRFSQDYKPLWFAFSKKDTLAGALENLAAREGAPKRKNSQNHDTAHLFYVKSVGQDYKKSNNEKWVPGVKGWITKKALHRRQQPSDQYLKKLIKFTIQQKADAAIWVALPSHVIEQDLLPNIKGDKVFVKNTQAYIKKMPPGNQLSGFEQEILGVK